MVESTSSKPFWAFAVGNRDTVANPDDNLAHQVWVWNDTGRKQEVTVEIGDESDSTPWFSRSYDLGTDANLAIDLRESRAYAITVRVDGRKRTVSVSESRFDCNDSATDIVVREDEIETSGITTDMDCGGLW